MTRKQYLGDRYEARTIRHGNAVLRSFYEFWIELARARWSTRSCWTGAAGRANAHHNPLEPFRAEGRMRYNPKAAQGASRGRCPTSAGTSCSPGCGRDRDRAMLALAISTGPGPASCSGVRGCDVDWGEQLVRVYRKGSGRRAVAPGQSGGVRVDAAVAGRAGRPAGAG